VLPSFLVSTLIRLCVPKRIESSFPVVCPTLRTLIRHRVQKRINSLCDLRKPEHRSLIRFDQVLRSEATETFPVRTSVSPSL
jgi:hypothetical protein